MPFISVGTLTRAGGGGGCLIAPARRSMCLVCRSLHHVNVTLATLISLSPRCQTRQYPAVGCNDTLFTCSAAAALQNFAFNASVALNSDPSITSVHYFDRHEITFHMPFSFKKTL